jgi:mRNA interferase RelE/StbE
MRTVAYSKSSLKVIQRMPRNEADRIREEVRQYADDPKSLGNNVKALVGSPYTRLRAGDWRVIMDDSERTILAIVKIGPRGGVYE